MRTTCKVLSLLLSYPTAELAREASALGAAVAADGALADARRADLAPLLDELARRDLYELQERYVLLFDRTRSLSLHLFEHVHGESRDRGQAMVDLQQLYGGRGLEIAARELPDYLPMFLEFLSVLPEDAARATLGETVHIVAALRARLEARKSAYAGVFRAIEALARTRPDKAAVDEILADPDADPEDLAGLDRAWAEEPVTFGPAPGADGCSRAEALVREMGPPGPAAPTPGRP